MAGLGADAPVDPAGAPPLPAVDADDAARVAEEAARAEAALRAARFAAPGLGAGAEDGGGAEAPGVGAEMVPMGSPPGAGGAGGGGAHGGPDQPGMIERDEAALQALQKMYHDEDYAMDLVMEAATRLGDFQPAVAAARVMKSLVRIPRLKDAYGPVSSIDARRTQEFDSLELRS